VNGVCVCVCVCVCVIRALCHLIHTDKLVARMAKTCCAGTH
jgi:hypothetical protein